jgi:hypothetical protein
MQTEILVPWTTVGGTGPAVTQQIQDRESYIDTGCAPDMVFFIEVLKVTQGGGTLTLALESSPTNDAALFAPVVGPIKLVASGTPLVIKTVPGAASVSPLARFLRWHVTANSATSDWVVTFRVRAARSRTPFFSPTLIPGCVVWLRSDLGIPIAAVTSGSMAVNTTWSDQSGGGRTATVQGAAATYALTGVNGLPVIQTGATCFLESSSTAFASGLFGANVTHTLFSVVVFPAAANAGAFAATINTYEINSSFAQLADTGAIRGRVSLHPANIDAASSSPSSGALGIYSTAGNTTSVDLYINGSLVTSQPVTFTPGTPAAYVACALSNPIDFPLTGSAYEFIVYNSVLTAAQRLLVHRYLGARYGITVP